MCIPDSLLDVSAVLRDLNHPFVNGYKPAVNYQDSLTDAVLSPDPPIGVTLWWVVRGSEHEKSLVMQEN